MSLLTMFNSMLRHADLFDAMTEKLGIRSHMHERSGGIGVTRRAVSRCMGCSDTERCQEWLDANASEETSEAPHFCRNHDLFARLSREVEATAST